MNIENKIVVSLNSVGCLIDKYNKEDKLLDYIQDSLSLISFIVSLEENTKCDIDVSIISKNLYEKTMSELEEIIKESLKYVKNEKKSLFTRFGI